MLHTQLCVNTHKVAISGDTDSVLIWLLPEVAPEVGNNILVRAFLHHEDFLLDDGKVIPWKE